MPISVHTQNNVTTVTLSGEIDHHSARSMTAQLEEVISTLLPMRLVLDLSGVTFMDSSGIAVVMRTHRQLTRHGGTLRVVSIPTQPRKVLDAAGVGRIITLE